MEPVVDRVIEWLFGGDVREPLDLGNREVQGLMRGIMPSLRMSYSRSRAPSGTSRRLSAKFPYRL